MKNLMVFILLLSLVLILDFFVNVYHTGLGGKAFQFEEAVLPVLSDFEKKEYQFEPRLFGRLTDDSRLEQNLAPGELLIGKYKIELKGVLLEEQQPVALIKIQNTDQKLTQVGTLTKITKGQIVEGFLVDKITLNSVYFVKNEHSAVIKLFEGAE